MHQRPNSEPSLDFWHRRRLTILLVVAGLILLFALYLARGALFPFIISVVLAQLLHPAVDWLERRAPLRDEYPTAVRVVAILVIYVAFIVLAGAFIYFSIRPLFGEARELIDALPELYGRARVTIEAWADEYTDRIPPEVRVQIEEWVASGGNVITNALFNVLGRTLSGVSNAITLVIGLAIVPFFLFYLLKDRNEVVGGALAILPPRAQTHTLNTLNIVNNVIGKYVRAQLFSASIIFVLVFGGLVVAGVSYPLILAAFAGMFGLIPIIGAILGAVPAVLVALDKSPETAIGVAIWYFLVQLFESNVIAPRVHGAAVRLHPAIIMIVIVGASEIAGLWGVVVGVPVTAAIRDVFLYFHREWSAAQTAQIPQDAADETAPKALDSESQTPD